jgi:hypothetical protein
MPFLRANPRDKDDHSPELLAPSYESAAEMSEAHADRLRKLISASVTRRAACAGYLASS